MRVFLIDEREAMELTILRSDIYCITLKHVIKDMQHLT